MKKEQFDYEAILLEDYFAYDQPDLVALLYMDSGFS